MLELETDKDKDVEGRFIETEGNVMSRDLVASRQKPLIN